MNNQLEDLLYKSGLTAQGCWDEMDDYSKAAIEKFAELIVQDCADFVRNEFDSAAAEPIAWTMEINYGLHGDYV